MSRGFHLCLVITLAVLSGFQHFLHFPVTRLFRIQGRGGHRAVMAALLFLLLGAIASLFLQQAVATAPARAVAGGFLLSLSIGLNLSLGFLYAWAEWGCARIADVRARGMTFGWAAVALEALWPAYGVWNATEPKVERLTVWLNGLPEEWRGRTIVQNSDWRLVFSAGRAFTKRGVGMVNAEQPRAVAIPGDPFDGGNGGLAVLADPLNGIIAPMGLCLVTGNHESCVGLERVRTPLRGTRLR